MFSNHFIKGTIFPQNAPVKKNFENRSKYTWQRYEQKFVACFLSHPVYSNRFDIGA